VETRQPLPNVEAAARDHLANERTFLAWFRTGLGVGAIGLALPRLANRNSAEVWAAGAIVAVLGLGILAFGVVRHRQTEQGLREGYVSTLGRSASVLVFLAVIVGVAVAALLA
jgi:putative membrane protein